MAAPDKYTPSYSFQGFQSQDPGSPLPAVQVDNEFENIANSIGSTVDALNDIRRSDGLLNNGIVGFDQLDPFVRAAVNDPSYVVPLLTPQKFDANCGDGVSDPEAALLALALVGGRAYIPAGRYKFRRPIVFSPTYFGLDWTFHPDAIFDWSGVSSTGQGLPLLTITGSKGMPISASGDLLKNGRTITLSSVSGLSVGQDCIVGSGKVFAPAESQNQKIGQYNRIQKISGNTVTLLHRAAYDYLAADAATLTPVFMPRGVILRGITQIGKPNDLLLNGLRLAFLKEPEIYGLSSTDFLNADVTVLHCPGLYANISTTICTIDPDANSSNTNYGWALGGCSEGIRIYGHRSIGKRHGFTTTQDSSTPGVLRNWEYGWFSIAGKRLNQTGGTCDAFDNHACGPGYVHDGRIEGATGLGMSLSGQGGLIERVTIEGTGSHGISGSNLTDYDGQWIIRDCTIGGCTGSAIFMAHGVTQTIGGIPRTAQGRLLLLDIENVAAERYTARAVQFQKSDATIDPVATVRIKKLKVDAANASDIVGQVYLTGGKRYEFEPSEIINVPFNSRGYRCDSMDTINGDLGIVTFRTDQDTTGVGIHMDRAAAASVYGRLAVTVLATASNTSKGYYLAANIRDIDLTTPRGNASAPVQIAAGATYTLPGATPVKAYTADASLVLKDLVGVLNNQGATAAVKLTLPTGAPAGTEFTAMVASNGQTLEIRAQTGNTLRVLGTISASGGGISANVFGSTATFKKIDNIQWIALSALGTWSAVA